jgi:hypothetical protein
LSRRALENYFTDGAVKKALGESYGALGPFDAFSTAEPRWAKNQNWRIAAEMTREDLEGTDLGGFFSQLVEKLH